jgi:membrane protein DedA with SNARE-associated domain
MHDLLVTWFGWVREWGYWGVLVLMAMESSIFPVPSEVVIPPAAFLAARGEMSLEGVVIAGTIGSWVGSALTYVAARWVGRGFLERWGRWVLLDEVKLGRGEVLMRRFGLTGIFLARLLPVVRHVISIPAGLVRMPFAGFSVVTTVGAAVWCAVLAWAGDRAARLHPDLLSDPAALVRAIKADTLSIVGACVALAAGYVVMLRLTGGRFQRR